MENKYIVKVPNIFAHLIEIDANNEEEAKSKVKTMITDPNNNTDYPLRYEATLPEDNWGVITAEEFEKLKAEFEKEQQEKNS